MQIFGAAPGVRHRVRPRAARRADYLEKKLESQSAKADQAMRIAQEAEKRAKEAESRSLFREMARRAGARVKAIFARNKV